jgi:tetratricopeptide (TPR) repeat protein
VTSEYDAFISYRRSDGSTVAKWLRRELEGFRLPKALRATYGRKLRLYMDTAYERGTTDFYEESIKPALLASRYLIVVATPDAMRRADGAEDWVDREGRDFAAGPNSRNVMAVRGAGEFDAPLPGNLKERFPNIEIVDLRGAGRFWYLHPTRAARLANEKLKLIAPLLGIPANEMPRLRQEEEKRQQSRLGAFAGATLGVIVAVSGLSIFALQSRNQAIRMAEDAMFAAGGMAQQARELDTSNAATARTRRFIIARGCDQIDKFSANALTEPQTADSVMCKLERALHYEHMSEHAEARSQYGEAARLASARYDKQGRPDAALALLQARQARAEYETRQKVAATAETAYLDFLKDARRTSQRHDDRPDIWRYEAEANGRVGDVLAARNDSAAASEHYQAAARIVDRMLVKTAGDASLKIPESDAVEKRLTEIAWLVRLHRLAGFHLRKQGNNDAAMEQFGHALAARKLADSLPHTEPAPGATPANPPPRPLIIEYQSVFVQAQIFAVEAQRGHHAAAAEARQQALDGIARLERETAIPQEVQDEFTNVRSFLNPQQPGAAGN